jgi:hypothetical protein
MYNGDQLGAPAELLECAESVSSTGDAETGSASASLLDRLAAFVPYETGGCRTGGRRRAVLPRVCEVPPSPALDASDMLRLFIVDHGRGGQFTHDRVGAERDVLRAVRDMMAQHDNDWTPVADILFQREGFTVIAFESTTDQLAAAAVLQLSPQTKIRHAALVIRLALTMSLHRRRGFMKQVMWGIHHGARARDTRNLFLEVSNLDDTGSYWIKHCGFSLPNVLPALNVSEDEVYYFQRTDLLASAVVSEPTFGERGLCQTTLAASKKRSTPASQATAQETVRSPHTQTERQPFRTIIAQPRQKRPRSLGQVVSDSNDGDDSDTNTDDDVIESDTDTDDDVIESDTNIDDDVIETFAQGDCAECPHCKQWNQCTTPDGGDGMICSECDAIIWANPEQPTELDEERIRDIELEEHPIIRLMTKHATKWTEEEELQLEVLVQRWIREEGVNPTKLAPSAIKWPPTNVMKAYIAKKFITKQQRQDNKSCFRCVSARPVICPDWTVRIGYRSQLKVSGETIFGGTFFGNDNEIDAAKSADELYLLHRGHTINFPDGTNQEIWPQCLVNCSADVLKAIELLTKANTCVLPMLCWLSSPCLLIIVSPGRAYQKRGQCVLRGI